MNLIWDEKIRKKHEGGINEARTSWNCPVSERSSQESGRSTEPIAPISRETPQIAADYDLSTMGNSLTDKRSHC